MKTVNEYEIPIKELFSILEIDNITYDEEVENRHDIKIQSINGEYVEILYFIKKYHESATYVFESDDRLTCSINHIVYENNVPKFIKDCTVIDTIHNPLRIVGVDHLGSQEVYDVSLPPPHKYITPNGIIHHNTTLARVLLNELNVNPLDILEINASRERGIDVIKTKITNFVSTIPMGNFKIVLFDEADYLTPDAQASMRGVMETYATTARFILTCNYPQKIIPALHSRCQGFHIQETDMVGFTERCATILLKENIEFDLDTLDTFVKASYPDLRKTINNLQQNCSNGKLSTPTESERDVIDYKPQMVELFKKGKIREARKLVCENARDEDYEELFRWLYDNLNLFTKNDDQQEKALVIIRNALVNNTLVADPEINFAACCVELAEAIN